MGGKVREWAGTAGNWVKLGEIWWIAGERCVCLRVWSIKVCAECGMCELEVGCAHELRCCDGGLRIKKCHWCWRRYMHTHKEYISARGGAHGAA